jgi:acetylornithine deacetylase/succinyl-diaminopimelate desuccinylase-like protein
MIAELFPKLDRSYTLRILEDMIRIDSIVGREGELAEYICGQLETLGLACERHEVEPGRLNIWTRCPCVRAGTATPSRPW